MKRTSIILLLLLGVGVDRARAEQPPTSTPTSAPTTAPSGVDGSVVVNGQRLDYRATAGTLAMRDEAGKERASFFFVAYELKRDGRREADADPRARPLTFVFNGGPGAAAVWLHLGTAGPKRVDVPDDGTAPVPPYRLVDNEATWLDVTDLVFIDPVGTGFSRAAQGEKPEDFYGVERDIASVADFIRLYTTRYERWLSPKFLAGESYGTTRAAGLSEFLADRYGISLNGVILISSVLNFQTIQIGDGNNLPYPLYLPTYAAVAWYHKRLDAAHQKLALPELLKQVEVWSADDYTVALGKGDALSDVERKAVVARLVGFTGLSERVIERSNLRVSPGQFSKSLLEPERKLIGRFDGRLVGADPEPAQPWPSYDPSLSPFLSAYGATFNDYVRRTLRFESELPYEVLSDKVGPWDFSRQGGGYLYVGDNLRGAMVKNPSLRVMVAASYFDFATPYFASDYTINQLDLPAELRGNIRRTYYPAGHMMYHERASREKLKSDVAEFMRWALSRTEKE